MHFNKPMGDKVEDMFHEMYQILVEIIQQLYFLIKCEIRFITVCYYRTQVSVRFTETNTAVLGGTISNNYRLLPHATMLYWVLIIMEQSTPHITLWASNSTGKHTCCGELWVSWVLSPRRPSKTEEQRPNY